MARLSLCPKQMAVVWCWPRRRATAICHYVYRLSVLDLEVPMLARVDGHRVDPLHYCMPGPPDLMAYALASRRDW